MDAKSIDRDQLGQLIRMQAHFINVGMECESKDKEIENAHCKLLDYLKEWEYRGYKLDSDKLWAKDIISKYDGWLKSKKKLINRYQVIPSFSSGGILDIIKERRSIRFWKKQNIPREVLLKVIEAAVYAPSSFNRMPWRFYVVENKLENIIEGDSSNKSMIEKAPSRIYITIDERLYEEGKAPAMDAALAAQNILLTAHSLGLGSCIIYQCELIEQGKLKIDLNIPDYYYVYCVVLLGYPDETPTTPGRIGIEEVTSFTKLKFKNETYLT